jgi:hypothetical protein
MFDRFHWRLACRRIQSSSDLYIINGKCPAVAKLQTGNLFESAQSYALRIGESLGKIRLGER